MDLFENYVAASKKPGTFSGGRHSEEHSILGPCFGPFLETLKSRTPDIGKSTGSDPLNPQSG